MPSSAPRKSHDGLSTNSRAPTLEELPTAGDGVFHSRAPVRQDTGKSDLESQIPSLIVDIEPTHEDYPLGYPRLASFLSQRDANFSMFRRFTYLRTRILLNMQDELCSLQDSLQALDSSDTDLNLGSRRHDTNPERGELLSRIEKRLGEYDALLSETQRLAALPRVRSEDFQNVVNWVRGNEPVNREELGFLENRADLVPGNPEERPVLQVISEKVAHGISAVGRVKNPFVERKFTEDKEVIITDSDRIVKLTKFFITFLASMTLIVPIIVLYYVKDALARLLLTVLFTGLFSVLIVLVTNSVNNEVFTIISAYAAVIVVFLGNVI